ncbi:uncharacterized protein LOC62_06G008304 [Vanrija pseudolonga]|uniref:Transcriptional coactivator HFI1/ADA1 n=1 Tax=Vanrija pseudolonga TaxID=143232 RepID=A0AAF1BL81_9TREE|nr:hypothetical protein LOC62_06G008304 [Vanrija pseudolonga]
MSNHVPATMSALAQHASTSANPIAMTPASYHPGPRPTPAPGSGATNAPATTTASLPPFHRIDTHQIKQQLHDALGEAGLPYWKALNGYLLGQVGRDELTALVRGWLKGKNLALHNQLLYSLLHNASSPQISHEPTSQLNMRKRRRGSLDAPDFDSDESFIESKERVYHWVMGLGGKERGRVRRTIKAHDEDEDAQGETDGPVANGNYDPAPDRKRQWSAFQSTTQPPLAESAHLLPSSNQLAMRLGEVAKSYDLELPADSAREVGEFLGVGLNAHLGDVLHSVVHLTGRERPGFDTIHVPQGIKQPHQANGDTPEPPAEDTDNLPPPTLQTLQYLFNMLPSLHPQASPTLYKLESSITISEVEAATPPVVKEDRATDLQRRAAALVGLVTPAATTAALPSTTPQKVPGAVPPAAGALSTSPVKAAATLRAAAGQGRTETVSNTLINTGLLKIDKAGRGDEPAGTEADRKREKKHNLHWKYEDPAIILKDVLG